MDYANFDIEGVVAEGEVRTFQTGNHLFKLRVAVTTATQQGEARTNMPQVLIWNRPDLPIVKGVRLRLQGSVRTSSFVPDGQKEARIATELVAHRVTILPDQPAVAPGAPQEAAQASVKAL